MEETKKKLQDLINKMNQSLKEIEDIKSSVKELETLKDEEILAPIANGIFIKAKIIDSKKLKVNVGNGVILEKTINQTIKLLDKQEKEIKESVFKAKKEMELFENV
ncbi:MAG: prefoldin subunit alpha [Candidatus Woesearchaeota archaeon]